MSVLERINGHQDLISLDNEQRELLCREIRDFLVEHIAKTGGHLASNLGVVELTVAIETVYNTALDRLVFDVGHQSYVHKLLTGRRAAFDRLRQYGGISGFPKPGESDTDAFVAGHASSSVSIALGMARARTLQKQNYEVVALLGDGAATGGMVYEGLNDTAESQEPMVVILNDNEMSIDRNVGGMASHLRALRTKESYLGMKQKYRSMLSRFPGGQAIYRLTRNLKDRLRRMLIPTTIFENMGMTYMGPVDGHDLPELINALRTARDLKRPVLVHVITHKGHGYLPAEADPSRFHGISGFDPVTGKSYSKKVPTFSDAFGEAMCQIAAENDRLCAITAAMPGGTGLLPFKEKYPDRLFDVGIAEEHAVSMAGGLAKQGMVPVVALYSTFLQRSYDQILQDVGLLKLPVILAIDRAGLVGEDGETHHGVFDVGFLRQIPGMEILCPVSREELKEMLSWAVKAKDGPVAIRYPRGGDGAYTASDWNDSQTAVQCHRSGRDVTILTYGPLLNQALAAADLLQKQGIDAAVLRLLRVGHNSVDEIFEKIPLQTPVVLLEEVCAGSGIRGQMSSMLGRQVYGVDLGDAFATHGDMASLYKQFGLDAQSVCDYVMEVLRHED